MRSTLMTVVLSTFWLACAEGPPLGTHEPATPSSTVAALRDLPGQLVTVNVDEGTVTWLDTATGATQEVPVGGEPTRVASAGDRVWVTLRLDGEVVALRATGTGLEITGRRFVGAEPYGIVTRADGSRVYVAVSSDDQVVELDGASLEPLRRLAVPNRPQWLALHPNGTDLVVASARGETLLWFDLGTEPLESSALPLEIPPDGDVRVSGDPAFTPDGEILAVPTVFMRPPILPLNGYYAPRRDITGAVEGVVQAISVGRDGQVDRVEHLPADHIVTHVTWSNSGDEIYGTVEGMDLVTRWVMGTIAQSEHLSGRGPRGLAMLGDEPWVHAAFDLTLAPLRNDTAAVPMAESVLDPTLQRGRRLFYSALDPKMSAGGVSCASCHVEGRSDGQTWQLASGEWQTPSLAGDVDATAPVTWSLEVGSVAEEANLTLSIPMGGSGLGDEDLQALAAFVNDVRLPVPPTPTETDDVLALGERMFRRADVGCAECHNGPQLTDNQSHQLFGRIKAQTPTLRGIAASAPYLHDGRAETLEELLQSSERGKMGNPELLTFEERQALIAWLKTL